MRDLDVKISVILYVWRCVGVCGGVCECASSIVSDSLQPKDCSLPDSSVHGVSQARILERALALAAHIVKLEQYRED